MTRPALLFPELEDEIPARKQAKPSKSRGVLPSQELARLIAQGSLTAGCDITPRQVQPASIDLRLGDVAYHVSSSFLPGSGRTVLDYVDRLHTQTVPLTHGAILQRGRVYIVPLLERVSLPPHISGRANPKSTTGRLDVFTRLITDNGTEFENVPAGYSGPLFAEIFPRTFSIRVRTGTTLNQLRLFQGNKSHQRLDLNKVHSETPVVFDETGQRHMDRIEGDSVLFSVELRRIDDSRVVGYRARQDRPYIDFDNIDHYCVDAFWVVITAPKNGFLILRPNEFYILASKERIVIPATYAAEMIAYDASLGEFRVHYAGFFDPGFGLGRPDQQGSRAVLEVRSHEVPFLLEDGQTVGKLRYENLLAAPATLYGADIGSSYNHQGVTLSKHFRRN